MKHRAFVAALDLVAMVLIILALKIISSGGFVLHVTDIPLRFRTPTRTIVSLGIIIILRLLVDLRTPPFGLARSARVAILSRVAPLRVLLDNERPFELRSQRGSGRRAILASLGIGLALGILLQNQVRHLYSVPDRGDPLFSMWRLGWVDHQLATAPTHLFDANIFYPERLTLALSDPMIVPALMAAPFSAFGLHAVVVYNLLLLSAFWSSGIAAYLLVERLTRSPRSAFIAGLMFACYSYRFDHYSHLELQMTQWMPLGLIALHMFAATGRYRYAMALAFSGVVQLYSSMYYGVLFLVYVAVIGVGLMASHRLAVRRACLGALGAAVMAAILVLPLVIPFLHAQTLRGDRPIEAIDEFSAVPLDYLRTHRHSATWQHRMLPPVRERGLFPGLAPIVLGGLGLAPPFSVLQLVYAAGLFVCYDASLGFHGRIYPYLHAWFPPVRSLRAPARFSILVGLTLSIFAGFGTRRILRRCRNNTTQCVALSIVALLIMLDAWPSMRLEPVWKSPPQIYAYLPATQNVVLAEFPVFVDDPAVNIPFMFFSLWHWRPMVNGYSGFIPLSYRRLVPDLMAFPSGSSIAVLRDKGVTHVVINCGLGYPGCEVTRARTRQSNDLRFVQSVQWEGRYVELYELLQPGAK